jgi:cysteine desulfurase/selenocysteine lyase
VSWEFPVLRAVAFGAARSRCVHGSPAVSSCARTYSGQRPRSWTRPGDAAALGAALDFVRQVGLPAIASYEHDLLGYAIQALQAVPGLRLIGTAPEKTSVLSFVLDGYPPEDVGTALDKEGIAVRAGHHCAQPILRRYGLESTVRPSLAMYNTCGEVDMLAGALHRLAADAGRHR